MLWKVLEYHLSDSTVIRVSGPDRASNEMPDENDEFTFQVTNSAPEGSEQYEVIFEKELLREDVRALHRALGQFIK